MKRAKILLLVVTTLLSTDFVFAQSWQLTSAPTVTDTIFIASSADGTTLAAVGDNVSGVLVSTNSGATWTLNSLSNQNQYPVMHSVACSADGSKVVAADFWMGIYVSTNTGTTWIQTGALGTSYIASLASSADGTKMVATVGQHGSNVGPIYASTNSGITWTLTGAPTNYWISVASSADGSKLVAATFPPGERTGLIYTSTNSGMTWVTTSAPGNSWTCVASSADGARLIAASGPDTSSDFIPPIYTSTDSGATWITNNMPGKFWQGVASSADGNRLVAVAQGGIIYTSTNCGATWILNSFPDPSAVLWSVASSADGGKLAAGVNGVFSGIYVDDGGGIYTCQTIPAPVLNITPSSGNLALSWIIPSTNFGLQQNSDLTTTNWMDVTNAPTLNLTNLQNQVILSPPGSNVFYRLKTP
jgi:hypothetical protein